MSRPKRPYRQATLFFSPASIAHQDSCSIPVARPFASHYQQRLLRRMTRDDLRFALVLVLALEPSAFAPLPEPVLALAFALDHLHL